MKACTKLYFRNEDGEKFFGEGPWYLLQIVEETGSLRQAAMRMGMAYSKALHLIQNAEQNLGFSLLARSTGGSRGGGSVLTQEGRCWMEKYAKYRMACIRQNEELFREIFLKTQGNEADVPVPGLGCIVMASGNSRRFGSNKLLAPFGGQTVIGRVLAAVGGMSERELVLTRSAQTAACVRECGMQVMLHDLPGKSDAVRLGTLQMQDLRGVMFTPADQPCLSKASVRNLVSAWEEEPDKIWRLAQDRDGNGAGAPVIFPAAFFPELMALTAERGGGFVAAAHPEAVRYVSADPLELADADTPETLEYLKNIYYNKEHSI